MSEARARPQRQRPTLDEVLRTLRAHLPELREQYGVRTLGVFGSYVRGEQKPRSDLDLLVEFDQAPTLPEFIDLEYYLRGLLGVRVDLVTRRVLKGEIGRRILREVLPV
jgi:predicted nucleotidyltransferase